MAEQHPAFLGEALAQAPDELDHGVGVKIDQDVAAQDQVEIRELERRGPVEKTQQVVALEADDGAELRPHLPLILVRHR